MEEKTFLSSRVVKKSWYRRIKCNLQLGDVNVFCQLYIASQFEDGDLDEFLYSENTIYLLALSKEDKLNLPSQ